MRFRVWSIIILENRRILCIECGGYYCGNIIFFLFLHKLLLKTGQMVPLKFRIR